MQENRKKAKKYQKSRKKAFQTGIGRLLVSRYNTRFD